MSRGGSGDVQAHAAAGRRPGLHGGGGGRSGAAHAAAAPSAAPRLLAPPPPRRAWPPPAAAPRDSLTTRRVAEVSRGTGEWGQSAAGTRSPLRGPPPPPQPPWPQGDRRGRGGAGLRGASFPAGRGVGGRRAPPQPCLSGARGGLGAAGRVRARGASRSGATSSVSPPLPLDPQSDGVPASPKSREQCLIVPLLWLSLVAPSRTKVPHTSEGRLIAPTGVPNVLQPG